MAPDRINPYESPATSSFEAHESTPATSSPETSDGSGWRWRQALLKSLVFMRCAAIFGGIYTGRQLIAWVAGVWNTVLLEGIQAWQVPWASMVFWIASAALYVGASVLYLYSCVVLWRYARELRLVTTNLKRSPLELCELHLRFWRLSVIYALLSLASGVVDFFYATYADQIIWNLD